MSSRNKIGMASDFRDTDADLFYELCGTPIEHALGANGPKWIYWTERQIHKTRTKAKTLKH